VEGDGHRLKSQFLKMNFKLILALAFGMGILLVIQILRKRQK